MTKADTAHNFIPVKEALPAFYLRLAFFLSLLLLTTALTGCGTMEKNRPPAPPASTTTPSATNPVFQMSSATLAANATPLGIYDGAVIEKIRDRWFQILHEGYLTGPTTGKVTVKFHLHADGQVSEVMVTENTVSAIQAALSQKAIEKSAPFPPWPAEVRQQIGKDYREISFTFHYQ